MGRAARTGGDDGTGGDGGGDEAGRAARAAGDGRPVGDGGGDGDGVRLVDAACRAAVGRVAGVAPRPGEAGTDENTGVTGAGGRRGALCGVGAAENLTPGAGALSARLGVAGAASLNATRAAGPAGDGRGVSGGDGWENCAVGTAPLGDGDGDAGDGALLNVGAPVVPAGDGSGV